MKASTVTGSPHQKQEQEQEHSSEPAPHSKRRHEGSYSTPDTGAPISMSQADMTQMRAWIGAMKEGIPLGSAETPASSPKSLFAFTITLGNVLAIMAALCSGFGAYYGIKADVQDLHAQIALNRHDIDEMRLDAASVRLKYIPLIEKNGLEAENSDVRFENLVQSVSQLRETVQDLAKATSQTHEDMAVLKSQLRTERTIDPRSPEAYLPSK